MQMRLPSLGRLLGLALVPVLSIVPLPLRSQDAAGQAVMKFEQRWGASQLKKDGATLAKMLSEDFTFVGPDGKVSGKAQVVSDMNSDTTHYVSGSNGDMKPRVHGNTVVITGIWTVVKRAKVGTVTERYLWTDTWIKGADGAWLCIAGQSMRLAR